MFLIGHIKKSFEFAFILVKDGQIIGFEGWNGSAWCYAARGAEHLDPALWSICPINHDYKLNFFTGKEHNARVLA